MTVSSTYSYDPDLRAVSRMARRLAGVLGPDEEPSNNEVAMDGELLNLQLKEWQLGARLLKQTERVTVTIDATARTTGVVAVDADTIDIEFPISLKLTSGDQRYRIRRRSRPDFLGESNPDETGIPTEAMVERKTTVGLRLWPIPSSTCESIEFVRVFLIRDAADGFTLDVWQRCGHAAVIGLAVDVAENNTKDHAKVMRLQNRYDVAKRAVMLDNQEKGDVKFSLRG